MTKLDQDITGIDIFSPTAWWPEDEIVKRDLGVQRRRLRALLQSAPAEDASDAGVELEDWCRQWKDVTVSEFSMPAQLTDFKHVQIGIDEEAYQVGEQAQDG
jgi:hypothetical protein